MIISWWRLGFPVRQDAEPIWRGKNRDCKGEAGDGKLGLVKSRGVSSGEGEVGSAEAVV